MMKIGSVIAMAVLLWAVPGFAETPPPDVAIVPGVNGASFVAERVAGSSTTALAASGDGARFVACGRAVVAATHGSRVSIVCGDDARVSLEEGAFLIVAGSRGIRIEAGGRSLTASNAIVAIARTGGAWLARRDDESVDGAAAVEPISAAQAVAAESPSAPREAALTKRLIALDATDVATAVEADGSAAVEALFQRATPARETRRALVPRRVEKPIERHAAGGDAASAGDDVEIESIEVEVGCIEVCVD